MRTFFDPHSFCSVYLLSIDPIFSSYKIILEKKFEFQKLPLHVADVNLRNLWISYQFGELHNNYSETPLWKDFTSQINRREWTIFPLHEISIFGGLTLISNQEYRVIFIAISNKRFLSNWFLGCIQSDWLTSNIKSSIIFGILSSKSFQTWRSSIRNANVCQFGFSSLVLLLHQILFLWSNWRAIVQRVWYIEIVHFGVSLQYKFHLIR